MAPSLFKAVFLTAALASITIASSSPAAPPSRFVRVPVAKGQRNHIPNERQRAILQERQEPFEEDLSNQLPQGHATYLATIGVGTPSQQISLVLDTGSSDIWMFSSGACPRENNGCGGVYNIDDSSSAEKLPRLEGLFQIKYGDGSQVEGNYFRDDVDVGGVRVQGLTLAAATRAQISSDTGVMGVGYRANEAVADQADITYDNIMDVMLNDSLVSSKTYSLYLDDLEASSGQIIFGGYDPSRWQGDLQIVPVVPDADGVYRTFSIVFSTIGITTPNGGSQVLSSNSLPVPVLLDSGSSIASLPSDIVQDIVSYFGAQPAGDGSYLVDCSLGQQDGTLDFGLSGDGGPIIAVPFSEIVIPLYQNGQRTSQQVCLLGLQEATSDVYVFGDTILRSAYIVYDLDNNLIGLSQTVFNDADDGNIQEIPSGGVTAIPSATMAPDQSIPQFATGSASASPGVVYGYPGGYAGGYSVPPGYGSDMPAATASSAAIQGTPTSYTNRFEPTGGAGAGGSSGSGGSGGNQGVAATFSVATGYLAMLMCGAAVLLM